MLEDVCVVGAIEAPGGLRVRRDVDQHLVQDVEADVGHVSHGVLECPNDRIENQSELLARDV